MDELNQFKIHNIHEYNGKNNSEVSYLMYCFKVNKDRVGNSVRVMVRVRYTKLTLALKVLFSCSLGTAVFLSSQNKCRSGEGMDHPLNAALHSASKLQNLWTHRFSETDKVF